MSEEKQRIELVEGDAFDPGMLPNDTTHVFCNSLTFDDDLQKKLITAMVVLQDSLSCFMSSARYDIPAMSAKLGLSTCLRLVKSVKVEMSWGALASVHYY